MKFAYTGREDTNRSSFMPKNKRGSFLDRFKGRTLQMSKEGHVGVVNSTKIPIKPSYDNPDKSYSSYVDSSSAGKQSNGYTINPATKSNLEALSPMKRSNLMATKFSTPDENRYSFASNFKKSQQNTDHNYSKSDKNQNFISKCEYNDMPALQKRMSEVGQKIMRYSPSDNFGESNDRYVNSVPPQTKPTYNSSLLFRNSFQTPTKSSSVSKYGQMSSSLQGFTNEDSSFKGSFYSSRTANVMNSSSYSMGVPQPYQSYTKAYPMRNSGYSFNNSNGFYPTAASTPAYDKNNENIKISSKADDMIRRTEEMAKIHKPQPERGRESVQVKQSLEMNVNSRLNNDLGTVKREDIKLSSKFTSPQRLNLMRKSNAAKA